MASNWPIASVWVATNVVSSSWPAVAHVVSSPLVKSAANWSNNVELRSSADKPAIPAIASA